MFGLVEDFLSTLAGRQVDLAEARAMYDAVLSGPLSDRDHGTD